MNNNELQELESLRDSYKTLNNILDEQPILTDNLIRKSMAGHVSSLQKRIMWMDIVLLLVLAVLWLCAIDYLYHVHEHLLEMLSIATILTILHVIKDWVMIRSHFDRIIADGGSIAQIARHAEYLYNARFGRGNKVLFVVFIGLIVLCAIISNPFSWRFLICSILLWFFGVGLFLLLDKISPAHKHSKIAKELLQIIDLSKEIV